MKVFELMTKLSSLPSGAEVVFRTLCYKKDKQAIDTFEGDANMYEVEFTQLQVELSEADIVTITT